MSMALVVRYNLPVDMQQLGMAVPKTIAEILRTSEACAVRIRQLKTGELCPTDLAETGEPDRAFSVCLRGMEDDAVWVYFVRGMRGAGGEDFISVGGNRSRFGVVLASLVAVSLAQLTVGTLSDDSGIWFSSDGEMTAVVARKLLKLESDCGTIVDGASAAFHKFPVRNG